MKKVFSTIAAALVALAFAGTVLAADAPKTEAAPAMPAGHPPVAKKEEGKPAKKAKKVKKAKKAVKKEEAKPAEAPAAAPAAK